MFFTYIIRELRRRYRQAVLTAVGLAVGVALVVAVSAYAGGVSKAQTEVLSSLYGVGTDITVTQTAKMSEGGSMRVGMNPGSQSKQGKRFTRANVSATPGQTLIAGAKLAKLTGLEHVSGVAGALTINVMEVQGKYSTSQSSAGSTAAGSASGGSASASSQSSTSTSPIDVSSLSVAGVDTSQNDVGLLSATALVSGRSLTAADATAKVALVDKAYAKQNSLKVGSTLKIGTTKVKVVGVVTASGGSSASENVYIPLRLAQKISDNEGKVNQIYVSADSAANITAVQKEVKSVMPKATVVTSQDLASQVSGSLSSAASLAHRLGTWLSAVALIAAVAVASLLTVSATGRRVREFGTLKALGWKGRRVVAQVLGETMVQGVLGGILGAALGVAAARAIAWASPALTATLGSTGSAGGFGQAVRSVSIDLTAPVNGSLVALAVGLAIAGGLIAGAFGGWRASRLRPADALRQV